MSAKHNAGIIGLNVIDDIMHSVTRHVSVTMSSETVSPASSMDRLDTM